MQSSRRNIVSNSLQTGISGVVRPKELQAYYFSRQLDVLIDFRTSMVDTSLPAVSKKKQFDDVWLRRVLC